MKGKSNRYRDPRTRYNLDNQGRKRIDLLQNKRPGPGRKKGR